MRNIISYNEFVNEKTNLKWLTEEQIISSMDYFIKNDHLLESSKTLNKIYQNILNFLQKTKKLSKDFLNKIYEFIIKTINKLNPEKRDKFDKYFNKFQNEISDTLKIGLKKEELNDAVKLALVDALSKNLINKTDLKNSFNLHKKDIMLLIKDQVSKKLDDVKDAISKDLETIDQEVNNSFGKKIIGTLKTFSVGASFMTVFGLIDNLGLLVGMSAIEDWVMSQGFDAQVAAGIGNTFSDAIGVMLGGVVSASLFKILKVKGEGTLAQQFTGVVVGCMLPIIVKMLATMA